MITRMCITMIILTFTPLVINSNDDKVVFYQHITINPTQSNHYYFKEYDYEIIFYLNEGIIKDITPLLSLYIPLDYFGALDNIVSYNYLFKCKNIHDLINKLMADTCSSYNKHENKVAFIKEMGTLINAYYHRSMEIKDIKDIIITKAKDSNMPTWLKIVCASFLAKAKQYDDSKRIFESLFEDGLINEENEIIVYGHLIYYRDKFKIKKSIMDVLINNNSKLHEECTLP